MRIPLMKLFPAEDTARDWSLLKRGHNGVYHRMPPKHLDRYVTEISDRHNDLIAGNGL